MAGISKAERERRAAAGAESGTGGFAPDEESDAADLDADQDPGDEHVDHAGATGIEGEGEDLVLVRMARDGHFADVHPLEVNNYGEGGWIPVEG